MFNVVIIDDESFVIKSLVSTIDWGCLDLRVVDTFSDGASALEFIQTHSIDIVITDIRMPGFTGLDLCSILSSKYPHIQLILMSGYADFSYAQKAIKYNVLGYCVKPLDYDEFTLLLHKAVSNLSLATESSSNLDVIDCIENEDYTMLENYLTTKLINPSQFYIMISIGTDPITTDLPPSTLTFKFGPNKYIYILPTPYPLPEQTSVFPDTLKGIGIYPDTIAVSQLKEALSETIEMSYKFFFTGSLSICNTQSSLLKSPSLSKLQALLANNNLTSINLVLSSMQEEIVSSQKYSMSFALKVCNLLTTHYIIHYQLEEDDLYTYNFDQLIQKFGTFSNMLTTLYSMLSEELPSNELPTTYNTHFIQMIRYVNENYMSEITVGDVSNHLNLSSNYVSQLFKKETGTTYTKYLTNLRMEKAKNLLLQSSLSISDIGEQIGYNDYFYFLKTFKKHFGLSPGKYRSQLGQLTIKAEHSS